MRVHALTLGVLSCTAISAAFWLSQAAVVRAEVDLVYSLKPGDFTLEHQQILNVSLAETEAMWETVLTGYQPGISIPPIEIEVRAMTGGLASANYTGTVFQGGFRVATGGFININENQIDSFASGVDDPGGNFNTGLNYIDELMAHETGHVLGVGTLWTSNGIYTNATWTESEPVGQYLGQHGLEAYQQEFDQQATYVPVELAGNPGTPNAHWDQLMRSSSQEGDPGDPWSLSPLVGITDPLGRDLGLELMTGAIDPDYNEPFLSLTTIASMRDMGFTVTVPEDSNGDDQVDRVDLAIWLAGFGSTGLQIDSITYGDSQRDRDVDGTDFIAWQQKFSPSVATVAVPEPSSCILALAAMGILTRFVRRG